MEHVYRGTGTQQQVVTQLGGETVTLPTDLPASGRGLVGLALTTGGTIVVEPEPLATRARVRSRARARNLHPHLHAGKTTVVADALIAPHYHGDVDAAACPLPDAQSAMCVVPLRDHYGQVSQPSPSP